MIIICINSQ